MQLEFLEIIKVIAVSHNNHENLEDEYHFREIFLSDVQKQDNSSDISSYEMIRQDDSSDELF